MLSLYIRWVSFGSILGLLFLKNIQKYLQRLVAGEGSLGDQVENRRKQLELANRLEDDFSEYELEEEDSEIEYEGAAELEDELDDGALN